jgi:GT2 family glycosyltransferase
MMGAYLGSEDAVKGANKENPKGFWERDDILDINKAMLGASEHSWSEISSFEFKDLDVEMPPIVKVEAPNVLIKLDSNRPWAVKDPRMCLVLPYWRKLLEFPVCIHIYRNPLEVAHSLQKRNGFPTTLGIALWEKYNLCALEGSKGLPRIFLKHEDVIADPSSVVRHLYDELTQMGVTGLSIPAEDEITGFIDSNLHRERQPAKLADEYLNASQKKLMKVFKNGKAGDLKTIPKLSAGALDILKEHDAGLKKIEEVEAESVEVVKDKTAQIVSKNELIDAEREKNKELTDAIKDFEEKRKLEWTQSLLEREIKALETKVADRESQLISQERDAARAEIKLEDRERLRDDVLKLRARNVRLQDEFNLSEGRLAKSKAELQNLKNQLVEEKRRREEIEKKYTDLVPPKAKLVGLLKADEWVAGENKLLRESFEKVYTLMLHNEQHWYWQLGEKGRRFVGIILRKYNRAPNALAHAAKIVHQTRIDLTGNDDAPLIADPDIMNRKEDDVLAENDMLRAETERLFSLFELNENHWYWQSGLKLRRVAGKILMRKLESPYAFRHATEVMKQVREDTHKKLSEHLENQVKALKKTELFDKTYYIEHNLDARHSDVSPIRHYIRSGWKEGRNPSERFDGQFYLERDPKLIERPVNPLWHYLNEGQAKGREIARAVMPRVSFASGIKYFAVVADIQKCREIENPKTPGRVAVVIDLHDPEMADEIAGYMSHIQVPFDVYVSTSAEACDLMAEFFSERFPESKTEVRAVPDSGLDVAPFLIEFGAVCKQYDLVCKINTRKIMRYIQQRPDNSFGLKNLLGSEELVTTLFGAFNDDPLLGIVHPKTSTARRMFFKNNSYWSSNKEFAKDLGAKLKVTLPDDEAQSVDSWTGSMFWFRPAALDNLLSLQVSYDDFEAATICDGTNGHAIERMYGIVASANGFTKKSVFVYAPNPVAHKEAYDPISEEVLKDRIDQYKTRKEKKNRVVVYTAISGGYDTLKIPEFINPDYDYVCFSDRVIKATMPWEIRPIDYYHKDSTRIARYYKTHAHSYFKDYDLAIWIDANILIRGDLQFMIDRFVASGLPIASNPHPARRCVYSEAEICRILEKDDPDEIEVQMQRYRDDGFGTNQGMAETNVLIFHPNDVLVQNIFNDWWKEIDNGSRRDQLSFTYSLFKNNTSFAHLADDPDHIPRYDREHFELFLHGDETSWEYPLPYQIPGFLKEAYEKANTPYWENGKNGGALHDKYLWPYRERTVDIIIPIFNALEDVKLCLESVEKTLLNCHRLILVDDGSNDDTKVFLESFADGRPYVTLIRHNESQFYTKAVNAGIRVSTGDFIILLNSDTIVPANWIFKLVLCAESNDDIGIVGPMSNAASWQSAPFVKSGGSYAINPLPGASTVDEIDSMFEDFSLHPIYPKCSVLNGFCFCIKRKVIDKIGLFDEESFPRGYGEENDFCFRATDAGFLLAIATHTYVFHAKSKSYTSKTRLELCAISDKVFRDRYGENRINRATQSLAENPILARTRNAFLSRLKEPHPRLLWSAAEMNKKNARTVREISTFDRTAVGQWKITVTGSKPCFELSDLPFKSGGFYAVTLDVAGPEHFAKVFYRDTENGKDYSDSQSMRSELSNGHTKHVFAIPCDTLAPCLRIAPGSIKGDYVLNSIEIRSLDV